MDTHASAATPAAMPRRSQQQGRVLFMSNWLFCFVFIFFAGLLLLRTSRTVVAQYQQQLDILMAENDLPVMSHKHATNRRCAAQEPEPRRKTPVIAVRHLALAGDGSLWVHGQTRLRKCAGREWVA